MKNLITCLVVCVMSGTALADTWTVDDDGKADFDNIQAAIDASSDGDEILVMPGTYTGTGGKVVNPYGKEVWLHSSKGAQVTIIDGEGARRGIVCTNGETSNTRIEGFTITNGWTNSTGGGMFNNNNSHPMLTDCTFENNEANDGGGMYNLESSPTLENCTFTDNTANDGGGMSNDNSSPTLTNCTFTSNTTSSSGGGMHNNNSSPTLTDCMFMSNNANSKGGGMYNLYSNLAIDGCTFTKNGAPYGGGMFNDDSSPTLTGCTLINNNAYSLGGGIYNVDSSSYLMDTTVCSNTPDQIYGDYTDGGGNTIADECAVDTDGDGVPDDIDNCYLYNPNQADCNGNGIGDICDIADFTSYDCDANSVPDECQPDCDGDGLIDPCDNFTDVDNDGIPDECEEDCNNNSLPDDFEIELGLATDCNNNNIPDSCDIENNPSLDCDGNSIFDACEIESDPSLDCDNNGILDSCDLMDHPVGETKLTASDGASNDYFGCSVSISSDGTTAIVGAGWDDDNGDSSGSAYIYELVKGVWQETKLTASDGASNDYFGRSVSISSDGSTAIVGAHDGDGNNPGSGSAYIYELVGGAWEQAKLIASDGAAGDNFGFSVSISSDGSTAIVGAYGNDGNGSDTGSAYIYELVSGVWEETKLIASDANYDDSFGMSVSISSDGSTAIVGARYDDDNGSASGSAYIYSLAGGIWQETKLIASDGAYDDYFGFSVSISSDGTTALVGAYLDDDNGSDSGSAYIYKLVGGVWQESKLLANDGATGDRFGLNVSISSDGATAIVGADEDGDNGSDSGSAYIYRFDGSAWVEETKLLASDGESYDYFGESVSLSGNGTTALVGAFNDDDDGIDSGSAYVFGLSSDADCDGNGNIDSCDIEEDPSLDCNGDGILDSCQEFDDCNENGIPDSCDLQDPDNDQNNNGELDDCECIGDITADGIVNIHDLLILIGSYGSSNPAADFNFDGIVNVHDLLILINAWGECGGNVIPGGGGCSFCP